MPAPMSWCPLGGRHLRRERSVLVGVLARVRRARSRHGLQRWWVCYPDGPRQRGVDTNRQRRYHDDMFDHKDALIEAAETGNISAIRDALSDALLKAVDAGHANAVRFLLAGGADVHVNHDGPLRQAAFHGHDEVVTVLIGAGANVHAHKEIALIWAAKKCHMAAVRLLLAAGSNPVTAWVGTPPDDQPRVATTLDALGDLMTPGQREDLAAKSELFVRLRAMAHAEAQRQRLNR